METKNLLMGILFLMISFGALNAQNTFFPTKVGTTLISAQKDTKAKPLKTKS